MRFWLFFIVALIGTFKPGASTWASSRNEEVPVTRKTRDSKPLPISQTVLKDEHAEQFFDLDQISECEKILDLHIHLEEDGTLLSAQDAPANSNWKPYGRRENVVEVLSAKEFDERFNSDPPPSRPTIPGNIKIDHKKISPQSLISAGDFYDPFYSGSLPKIRDQAVKAYEAFAPSFKFPKPQTVMAVHEPFDINKFMPELTAEDALRKIGVKYKKGEFKEKFKFVGRDGPVFSFEFNGKDNKAILEVLLASNEEMRTMGDKYAHYMYSRAVNYQIISELFNRVVLDGVHLYEVYKISQSPKYFESGVVIKSKTIGPTMYEMGNVVRTIQDAVKGIDIPSKALENAEKHLLEWNISFKRAEKLVLANEQTYREVRPLIQTIYNRNGLIYFQTENEFLDQDQSLYFDGRKATHSVDVGLDFDHGRKQIYNVKTGFIVPQ